MRNEWNDKKKRIYICHTYYHVYVSFLKEFCRSDVECGGATLMLSTMSNDFESLKERVKATNVFEEILCFEEKRDDFFPELKKYKEDRGNKILNLISRIKFTREYARLEEPYVPVNLREYRDIYVYCDSDPIGYYLNQKKIKYHAVEDGLNCLKNFDTARYDNRGMFSLKAFLSNRLNLIFVQNGYGKYCIDMEVNDKKVLKYQCPKYVEKSRKEMEDALTDEQKTILIKAFVRDEKSLQRQIERANERDKKILVLTDPLCTLEIRRHIFEDIIKMYEREGAVFIKPHPRDKLDYRKLFSQYPQFDATLPMEILNFFPNLHFNKVVAVLTEVKAIHFADEVVRLGPDFMDKYEDPLVHRQNEQI